MPGGSRTDFRILEDIARDLSGDVNFPTCLDAVILVRDQSLRAYGETPGKVSATLCSAFSLAGNTHPRQDKNIAAEQKHFTDLLTVADAEIIELRAALSA